MNSMSFGGFRCITGRSSHSMQKNIMWSKRESSHKRAWEWMGNNIIMKYLKCPHGPSHFKDLVEIIKMEFWFTQFGVRTLKLWPSQGWQHGLWEMVGRPWPWSGDQRHGRPTTYSPKMPHTSSYSSKEVTKSPNTQGGTSPSRIQRRKATTCAKELLKGWNDGWPTLR